MSFNDFGAIGICIDEYDGGEMHGRLYNFAGDEPVEFNSVMALVKGMSSILDEGQFPQATMQCRGFSKKSVNVPARETRMADPRVSSFNKVNIRGKKATFRAKIMFRQNASWQGSLYWVEKNREENFRSVLEFMMLMDSSFEGEAKQNSLEGEERLTANM